MYWIIIISCTSIELLVFRTQAIIISNVDGLFTNTVTYPASDNKTDTNTLVFVDEAVVNILLSTVY